MNKSTGLAAVIMALAMMLVAPAAQASGGHRVTRAEAAVNASSYASIIRTPRGGYFAEDRSGNHDFDIPSRHVALVHCHGDAVCKATVRDYYRQLRRAWRVLNRNLWVLVQEFPSCTPAIGDNCAYAGKGSAAVILHGRWYVAHQRSLFDRGLS